MACLNSLKRLGVLYVAAAALASAASAGGTNAGTTVSNTFTLDYAVSGNPQPQITNSGSPTQFTVDRLVDLTITTLTPPQNVAPNSVDNEVRFRLTNLGNDTQAYSLSVSPTGTFTPTNVTIEYFIDLDNDGVLDAGETLLTYSGSPTVNVLKDQNVVVIVKSDVPTGTADGLTSSLRLTADTLFPTLGASSDPNCNATICPAGAAVTADTGGNTLASAAENVLADGAGVTDSANQGDYSAAAVLNVVAPTLVAGKTVDVFDTDPASDAACAALNAPASGDQYTSPGACVQYVISVANTGAGVASALDVQDFLPAQVRFIAAQLTTTSGTGFADDPGVSGAGPVLTTPPTTEVCDGSTNCLVQLTDAILSGGQNGQLRIWARVR